MKGTLPKIARPPETAPKSEAAAPDRRLGQIFTFYSFKGGVGRSMALANIAALAAGEGKRVLAVDWDLEAPGLEHYFLPHDKNLRAKLKKKPGIIDMLTPDASAASAPAETTGDAPDPSGPDPFTPWRDCVTTVRMGKIELDLIHSGKMARDDASYTAQVQGLDWPALYDRWDIGGRFDRIRTEWIEEYDLVFLDSRTGVTDIGDLCTVILPDHLVLLFITNRQNLDGIVNIYRRARAAHDALPRDRLQLTALPLLSRDEFYSEYDLSNDWRNIAADELGHIYADWLPPNVKPREAIQKLFIPYFAIWSFGEALPVVSKPEAIHNPASINAAYSRIAQLILHDLDWQALASVADPGEAAQTQAAREADFARRQRELEARQRRSSVRTLAASVAVVLGLGAVGGWYLWAETAAVQSLKQVEAERDALREDLAQASTELAVRSEQLAAIDRRIAEARWEAEILRTALNDRDQQIGDLRVELEGYTKQLAGLQGTADELARLRERLEKSEVARGVAEAAVDEVRKSLASAQREADSLRDGHDRAVAQAEKLRVGLADLVGTVSAMTKKEESYRARIAELETELKELLGSTIRDDRCDRRVDVLVAELEASTAARTEAARQIRQMRREFSQQPALVQKICLDPLNRLESALSGR